MQTGEVETERPWTALAACIGADPDLFFEQTTEDEEAARAICAVCPVRLHCIDYAIEAREFRYRGMWGGLTHRQLRGMWQRKRAQGK